MQTDGRIAVSCQSADPPHNLIRFHPKGVVDSLYGGGASGGNKPSSPKGVWGTAMQSDGKLLAVGHFTILGSEARTNIGRFSSADPAAESLTLDPMGTAATWSRRGSSPEVFQVTFEQSLDGTNFFPLGHGQRVRGGWQITGLAPPTAVPFLLRARGRTVGGSNNGSSGLLELSSQFYVIQTAADHPVRENW